MKKVLKHFRPTTWLGWTMLALAMPPLIIGGLLFEGGHYLVNGATQDW